MLRSIIRLEDFKITKCARASLLRSYGESFAVDISSMAYLHDFYDKRIVDDPLHRARLDFSKILLGRFSPLNPIGCHLFLILREIDREIRLALCVDRQLPQDLRVPPSVARSRRQAELRPFSGLPRQ